MIAAFALVLAVALPTPAVLHVPATRHTARTAAPPATRFVRGEFATPLRVRGDWAALEALAQRRYTAALRWASDARKISVPLRSARY